MKELKALTSMRGVAALAVVMQHFSTTAQQHAQSNIPSLVPHGYVAVDFFFVLSGYIMCYTYLDDFLTGKPGVYGAFLRKRVIRLLPLNVFVTLAILLLGAISLAVLGQNIFFGELNQPLDLICNLLLLQGLGIGTNLNGPAWSVSAEFIAYLLFPLLIAVAIRGNRVAVAGAAALAFAALAFVASTNPRLGLGSEDVLKGGLRCLSEFTLGILTFRIAQRPPWARWLAQDRTVYIALACCLGLLLLRIDLLVALSFPFLIGSLAKNEDRALRLLAHPALVMLGTISYSLYLIHNPFRPVALHILRTLHPEALATGPALAFALVASLLVIPFAWLTYRAVELPSRTFLNRRFARTVAA